MAELNWVSNGIHYLDISKNVPIFFYKSHTILQLKFVIQYLKTHFSCFPKEPKCGYLLKGTIKFETKF